MSALPESFGALNILQELYVVVCSNLENLPSSFGGLVSLRWLDLSLCRTLRNLPAKFWRLDTLAACVHAQLQMVDELVE